MTDETPRADARTEPRPGEPPIKDGCVRYDVSVGLVGVPTIVDIPVGKRAGTDPQRAEAEREWETRKPDGWRPIETAPRDMQRVLLFVPPYGPSTGHYDEGRWHCHSVLNWEAQPTHWMPLPPPPTAAGEGGGGD